MYIHDIHCCFLLKKWGGPQLPPFSTQTRRDVLYFAEFWLNSALKESPAAVCICPQDARTHWRACLAHPAWSSLCFLGVLAHVGVLRAKSQLPYPHVQASSKCDVWGTHIVGESFGWGSLERLQGPMEVLPSVTPSPRTPATPSSLSQFKQNWEKLAHMMAAKNLRQNLQRQARISMMADRC